MFEDRRKSGRQPHHAAVKITDRARRFRATTTDVSNSGAFVAATHPPSAGAEVEIELQHMGSGPVVLHAEVVRVAPVGTTTQPGFGVRWLSARCGRDPAAMHALLVELLSLDTEQVAAQTQVQADGRQHAFAFPGGRLPAPPQRSGGHRAISAGYNASVVSDAVLPTPLRRHDTSAPVDVRRPPQRRTPPPPARQRAVTNPAGPNLDELREEMALLDAFAPASSPAASPASPPASSSGTTVDAGLSSRTPPRTNPGRTAPPATPGRAQHGGRTQPPPAPRDAYQRERREFGANRTPAPPPAPRVKQQVQAPPPPPATPRDVSAGFDGDMPKSRPVVDGESLTPIYDVQRQRVLRPHEYLEPQPQPESPELAFGSTPQLSAPEHDFSEKEETTGAVLKRAFLSVTGKLFGRSEPVRMGAAAVSSDGWFYRPDGDGPLHVVEDEKGNVVQRFRTGAARSSPPVIPPKRPRAKTSTPSGGVASVTSLQAVHTRRAHSPTVPRGEAGELQPIDVPCSFILFRELCGGRMVAASRRGIQVEIHGEIVPRENQTIELNVPVYSDDVYTTISVHGPVLREPELVDGRLQFTMWVADVTEFGLKKGWERFLSAELDMPAPSVADAKEQTDEIETPHRRSASNG